ncbi:MAG: hypothetical protein ABII68_02365 [Pseudomonadota bacterium]
MKIREITEICGNLRVDEKRRVEEGYVELVIFNDEMYRWEEKLAGLLGRPTKPPGMEPSQKQEKITETFGGIQKSQTLFQKSFDGSDVIAMFWPWQNGEHVTLKIAEIFLGKPGRHQDVP